MLSSFSGKPAGKELSFFSTGAMLYPREKTSRELREMNPKQPICVFAWFAAGPGRSAAPTPLALEFFFQPFTIDTETGLAGMA
jgi:hypothetical protein